MNVDIDITCPACKHTFKERASNMEAGMTRACPNCGKTIEYTGDDLSKAEPDFNSAMADLKKSIKKSGEE